MRIDLHTHSNASDGTQSPAEVVSSAAESGLDVVALTDHDTTAGWVEAAEAAAREGVALVRGIEVSCNYEGISIHLLGYLQDPTAPGLLEELERSRESREARAQSIVERLSRVVPLTWDDVLKQVEPGATVGRHGFDDRVLHDDPACARERVRHHRDATGLPHEAHRRHRIGCIVRLIEGGAVIEILFERLTTLSDDPLRHHRICDVWAADGGPRLDLFEDVIPGQRHNSRQPLDDALHSGLPTLPRALQLFEQPRRRGVLEIAEQVDADAFVVAGDLDPTDKGDPFPRRGLSGLDPSCGRVVVGEGHDIQP